jgi:hypothetical protein
VGLSGPLGMNGVNAYTKPPSSQFQGMIGGMQMNALGGNPHHGYEGGFI